jgi:hypothetical protein
MSLIHKVLRTEPHLFTVGCIDANGNFDPVEDFDNHQDAQMACDLLNTPASVLKQIDALKAKLAAAELRECQQLALYSKAEATIGAALIDIKNHDNVECWLHGFIENTTTPWHLYDDAEVFHSRYAMEWPLSVAQHQENVKKLDAVFESDIARLEKQGGAS